MGLGGPLCGTPMVNQVLSLRQKLVPNKKIDKNISNETFYETSTRRLRDVLCLNETRTRRFTRRARDVIFWNETETSRKKTSFLTTFHIIAGGSPAINMCLQAFGFCKIYITL